MEATTMDKAAPRSASVTESPASMGESLFVPVAKVGEFLRWIWWLDLGAVALVGEQTARLFKAIVAKGKEVEPSVLKPFQKAESAINEAIGEVGSRLNVTAKPAETIEDTPLIVEMRELSAKVNELAQRIDDLQIKKSAGDHEEAEELAFKAAQQ